MNTTASTDGVLAIATAAGIGYLLRTTAPTPLRAWWVVALTGWGLSALLGVATHGLELDPRVVTFLWQPLYIGLGVAQSLVVVASVAAWRGDRPARRLLPYMLAAAAVFYWATWRTNGDFLVFVVFSAATTVFAIAVHGLLARRAWAGAGWVAAGLAASLASGIIQATSVSVRLVWDFDHNGVFHLSQMVALGLLIIGLRRLLSSMPQRR